MNAVKETYYGSPFGPSARLDAVMIPSSPGCVVTGGGPGSFPIGKHVYGGQLSGQIVPVISQFPYRVQA